MSQIPHPDTPIAPVRCAVVTASDTRTPETDKSGSIVRGLLEEAGFVVTDYQILKDEPEDIRAYLADAARREDVDAFVLNGGTGIAPRDCTYDAIASLLEKTLPGFGELFRHLSYAEIGSRAIASRAVAGVFRGKLIFSLPGSSAAVRLGMEKLILPELTHLVALLRDKSPQPPFERGA